jgi:hypothetical protein
VSTPHGRDYRFGNATRASGGTISRFGTTANHPPHGDRAQAALPASHPAIVENRTLFPSSVVDAAKSPRLLTSGFNQAKIGARIQKGPWTGLPVFCLTLEERTTCPQSCAVWSECYGNALPFARRHRDDGHLIHLLSLELRTLLARNPAGIAIRLHILGDFFSVPYVRAWFLWMAAYRKLRVWGYTAHQPGTPIGDLVLGANATWPDRWRVRCSVAPEISPGPLQATTIWRQPEGSNVPEGLVCPVSMHGPDGASLTQCCSTCGLCWSRAADGKRIVFIGHGMRAPTGPRPGPRNAVEKQIAFAGGVAAVARGMGFGAQAIARWGKTGVVPRRHREAFDALCDDLGRKLSGGATG